MARLVRDARRRLGLTTSEVAKRAGCAKSYVSMIENGRRRKPASREVLAALERVLHLPTGTLATAAHMQQAPAALKSVLASMQTSQKAAEQLAALRGVGAIDQAYRSGALQRLIDRLGPRASRAKADGAPGGANNLVSLSLPVEVPLINSVAAGYPREFTDLGYPARVADEYVRTPDIRDPDAFAARVVGDSMEPAYVEGDIVVFSPVKPIRSGMDCFVRLERDEQTTFKRVFFEGEPMGAPNGKPEPRHERIRLQPLNPKYPPKIYPREDVAGVYAAVTVMRQIG